MKESHFVSEGNLHKWFQSSSSKDGKPGWVEVISGEPCAREKGETGTPKCVSSSKRASMSRKERISAQRRKTYHDPNQPEKSGAAKPIYVSTDKPEKKMNEEKDIPSKGSGKKDACYHKVKSRYDVWPSAYSSGSLVKCRKVGAANWGNKSESVTTLKTYSEFITEATIKLGKGETYGSQEYQNRLEKQRRERQEERNQNQENTRQNLRNLMKTKGIRAIHNGVYGWLKDGKFTPDS